MKTISKNFDKEAQTKISKTAHSANIRQKRVMRARNATLKDPANENFCDECGFRVRSKNHNKGSHHIGTVAVCKRG